MILSTYSVYGFVSKTELRIITRISQHLPPLKPVNFFWAWIETMPRVPGWPWVHRRPFASISTRCVANARCVAAETALHVEHCKQMVTR